MGEIPSAPTNSRAEAPWGLAGKVFMPTNSYPLPMVELPANLDANERRLASSAIQASAKPHALGYRILLGIGGLLWLAGFSLSTYFSFAETGFRGPDAASSYQTLALHLVIGAIFVNGVMVSRNLRTFGRILRKTLGDPE